MRAEKHARVDVTTEVVTAEPGFATGLRTDRDGAGVLFLVAVGRDNWPDKGKESEGSSKHQANKGRSGLPQLPPGVVPEGLTLRRTHPRRCPFQPDEERLLHVEPAFRLVERKAPRRVEHLVGDFLSAMRRHVVHDHGMVWSMFHQRRVHLVVGKSHQPRL